MDDLDGRMGYAGFYWTYPVAWAGVTALPRDVDAAAARSRTIRYQRDLVRTHVAAERGSLVEEFLYLETAPDRPTEAIDEVMHKAVALCRTRHVCLVYVDFARLHGWRDHTHLVRTAQRHDLRTEALHPRRVEIDGEPFDPLEHFRRWRDADRAFRERRAMSAGEALAVAADMFAPGHGRFPSIAAHLNGQGILTHSGKAWTPDNVRMALRKASERSGEPD